MKLRRQIYSVVVTLGCAVPAVLSARVAIRANESAPAVQAVPASDFLNSIGTLSAISVRGESLDKTIGCCKYLGVRWLRAGIEGNVPIDHYLALHRQAGVRFSWGFGSRGSDLDKLLSTARQVAASDGLLAFEGPNEPNNWGITYKGEQGGRDKTWMPVAKLQRDMYAAVKADPALKRYPVFSISEEGAETDNVGLQYLTIPAGSSCSMPSGTKYADYANVHNYIYHPNSPGVEDNKTWNAADPTSACKVDGLFGEYGITWARHYPGYAGAALTSLPRVTTETGTTIDGPITEEVHALNLLSMYLDQFKRGWSYTCVYLLRDRVDEGGNQKFGFYAPDYTPRKAAVYLHNLTSILADNGKVGHPGSLAYRIPNEPTTVHDMLLQKRNGTFDLVVWDEQVARATTVRIELKGVYRSIRVFDPTIGTAPTQSFSGVSVLVLTLSNHPMVIELPPTR